MSDTDFLRETLELAEANGLILIEFASHCGLRLGRIEQWRAYLTDPGPRSERVRAKRLLLLLTELAEEGGEPKVVVRLVLDNNNWIEVPVGFSREHLLALLQLLRQG
jgi:hypothetical protein